MKLRFGLCFTIFYLIDSTICAYIPIQDDEMPSKAMQRQEGLRISRWDENESKIDCIPVLLDSDNSDNAEAVKENIDMIYVPSNMNTLILEEFDTKYDPEKTNCQLCKRNPMNPWRRVKHKFERARPATQQKIALGTGVGLVTLGAIATPVPEGPAKRDLIDENAKLITLDDEGAAHVLYRDDPDKAGLPGILCADDESEGHIAKRNQFLQTAGMAVMFGGMVIPPAVASVKTHVSKKHKTQTSSAPTTKRSLSFNQMEIDEAQEFEINDGRLRERAGGLEFLNTASLAGMLGGTIIMPGVAAFKSHQNKRKQGLQKRSPFFKLFKKAVKAIPTAISTGKDIHGIIRGRRKRSLEEDEFAPMLEKRARFKWGKALNHLNTAGTAAMVGSTGLAAHGSIKEGWNAKKNAAAAAAAPPVRKRDLEINISDYGREISIIKRDPTRGRNGGRARGSPGSRGAQKEAASAARHQAAEPKMSKMDKTMAGAGALMSVAMVGGFVSEVKSVVSGPKAQKRDEIGEEGALVKRARFKVGGGRKTAPKPAAKPAAKPAGKPPQHQQSGGGGKGIGGKIAGAAGAAMSATSVLTFASEAKAAVAKPPAPPARKRSSNEEQFMVKRAPIPTKIGGSPRTRTRPNTRPSPAKATGSSGGSKFGKALETAGTVSMVGSMATPALTPVASAAHEGWNKLKGAITGKKKP